MHRMSASTPEAATDPRMESSEGAVAVIVAICLLLLFGAGAIAIDLGSAWETKRQTVVDTDAAALAGARELLTGDCDDAETMAEEVLAINTGETSIDLTPGTDFMCNGTERLVQVDYVADAQQTLSGALGTDSLEVLSSSTATIADREGAALRPIAACLFDAEIQDWIDGGAGSTYRFDLSGSATNCGDAPGNWGWTCFDQSHGPYQDDAASGCDGNQGQTRINTMLEFGYSGEVDLGDPPPDPPAPDDEDCAPDDDASGCEGKRGSLGESTADALTTLKESQIAFSILGIYSYEAAENGNNENGNGNGNDNLNANAVTTPAAFIGVQLVDFNVSGQPEDRYLEFKLVNLYQRGTSAVLTEGPPTTPSAVICGTDGGSVCPGT